MNKGRALAIFEDIDNATEGIEEKGLAIRMVLDMETHNSVRKKSMLNVIEWLWERIFEVEQEGE